MKKKVFTIFLICMLVFAFTGCKNNSGEIKDMSNITNDIISNFEDLTNIPRPTYSEKEVSDYLKSWAENLGLEVTQDEVNNLIIDVPATEGMEEKPLALLQGHMDMVFAQKDGLNLDPLTTKICMVNDGTYLKSDGNTSLGADDGIGVAIMRTIMEGKMAHGPLRVIITTDEEKTSIGVNNIDPKYVQDSKYMINLDDELEGEIIISSASAVSCEFKAENSPKGPENNMGVKLTLSGLSGGHSGDEIHKGKLNGILAFCDILRSLKENNIEYEVSNIKGGNAENAIPTSCEAILSISDKEFENVSKISNNIFESYKNEFSDTDPDMQLEITECDNPTKVISEKNLNNLLGLTSNIINGVYTMSMVVDGLVESSSNVGLIDVDSNSTSVKLLFRSSSKEEEDEIRNSDLMLAKEYGFDTSIETTALPWPAKENNELENIAVKAYSDLFNKELTVCAIHAGLECGSFATYNPDLDIIAMGPTVSSPHSVKENVEIESIGKVWLLLEEILKNI